MSRFRALLIAATLGALGLGWSAEAYAGQSVALRSDVADQDGKVTLGDLFDAAGEAAPVVVASARAGAGVVLDAGRVQMIARANGLDWANETGIRRIVVRPGTAVSTLTVVARAVHSVEVLSYAHDLNTGDIVRPDDLVWSKAALPAPDAPRDAQAAIGLAARRPLREGAPVSARDLASPQVIKRDDVIALIYSADGVTLTLQAKAMENATAGQAFSVMNPESKKVIQAVATGPGQAVVGPQADQIRAAARLNPSLLASLR